MSPADADERRKLDALLSDVATLKERTTHILRRVDEVDRDCERRFREAGEAFTASQARKASTTVAWIGGACLLVTGLVQTIAPLLGGAG